MDIPECKPIDYTKTIDKAIDSILSQLEQCKRRGTEWQSAQINTINCVTGGYPMPVIMEVGKRFADKGYYVYLVTGGAYNNPSWMYVRNYECQEGYVGECTYPSYYKRIK